MDLMIKGWVMDTIRSIFGVIDQAIYSIMSFVFEGVFNVANVTSGLIEDPFVQKFSERIYVILAVFMAFKVIFSLLNAVVNPDALTDKNKGTNKLVVRILTSIVMLLLVEPVFTLSIEFQKIAMPILPRLIVGKSYGETHIDTNAAEMGDKLAFNLLSTFIHTSDECTKTPVNIKDFNDLVDFGPDIKNVNQLVAHLNDACDIEGKDNKYKYSYTLLLSSVVGIIIIVILLGFTIDIAIRLFKLIVLRMLAPIPIISYVDPKSSADGGMFSSWIKDFISTYADLFLRLGILYFVMYIIEEIFSGTILNTIASGTLGIKGFDKLYLYVFLIIGLFMFAKIAPKYIKNILGIKNKPSTAFGTEYMMGALGGVAGAIVHGGDFGDAIKKGGHAALANEVNVYNGGKRVIDYPAFGAGYNTAIKNRPTRFSSGLAAITGNGMGRLAGLTVQSNNYAGEAQKLNQQKTATEGNIATLQSQVNSDAAAFNSATQAVTDASSAVSSADSAYQSSLSEASQAEADYNSYAGNNMAESARLKGIFEAKQAQVQANSRKLQDARDDLSRKEATKSSAYQKYQDTKRSLQDEQRKLAGLELSIQKNEDDAKKVAKEAEKIQKYRATKLNEKEQEE